MTRIENAKITHTQLGNEDHGIFTCYLTCEGEGWGCGFGGYSLDEYDATRKRRIGTAYGMEFIKRTLATLEVENWEDLKGQLVRVETEGLGGGIVAIGHITKSKWFRPKEDLKEFLAKGAA